MSKKEIPNIIEYLSLIEELSCSIPNTGHIDHPSPVRFLYRGLANKDYCLLPSVFRKSIVDFNDRKMERDKYLEYISEYGILKEFIAEAYSAFPQYDSSMIYIWAEVAQHFGVPTRLLDWTSNALIALFFACSSEFDKDGKVWILNEIYYRNFSNKANYNETLKDKKVPTVLNELISNKNVDNTLPKIPIVYHPFYTDKRMSAQSSYFMAWGTDIKPLEKMIKEENYMKSNKDSNGVRSLIFEQINEIVYDVVIPADCKEEILQRLDELGINEKTAFPGLDGLGKYIERKHRYNLT